MLILKDLQTAKKFITNKINNALNGFYKSCTNEYINELHYLYFDNAENHFDGFKSGARRIPICFYIDGIEKVGFNAGVVSTIDLMANDNKMLFAGFYDVQTNEPEAVIPDDGKAKKRRKTLSEFINNIDNKEAFLNDLKNTFPTEIGLSIKAIVIKLIEVKILIYGTKEFKNLYEELAKYFDRNIGTYGSINDYNPDSKIIGTINEKLNPLIIKHKTT